MDKEGFAALFGKQDRTAEEVKEMEQYVEDFKKEYVSLCDKFGLEISELVTPKFNLSLKK